MDSKLSILIVDDQLETMEVLTELLEEQGYRVFLTDNSQKALSIAKGHKFDLYIMDIDMPELNGLQLLQELNQINFQNEQIPVIFISGWANTELKVRGFELGALDYICKPFSTLEALARIKRHLEIQNQKNKLQAQHTKLKKSLIKGLHLDEELTEKYEVIKLLGKGGMSYVYKARHRALDTLLALKLLTPAEEDNEEFSARFIAEAKAIAKIHHQNVVQVYDAGVLKNYHYIAMELVEGANLEKVRLKKELSYPFIHSIISQAAMGITAAHAYDIIHRDIKPSNLLIDRRKTIKIIDFGLAKDLNRAKLTQKGTFLGTPCFTSPEQSKGDLVDNRSDIYSLGITLFFLITGAIALFRRKFRSYSIAKLTQPCT